MSETSDKRDRVRQLAEAPQQGMVRELVEFMATNKKWWMLPLILVIVLLGVLVFLSGSAGSPFLYALF